MAEELSFSSSPKGSSTKAKVDTTRLTTKATTGTPRLRAWQGPKETACSPPERKPGARWSPPRPAPRRRRDHRAGVQQAHHPQQADGGGERHQRAVIARQPQIGPAGGGDVARQQRADEGQLQAAIDAETDQHREDKRGGHGEAGFLASPAMSTTWRKPTNEKMMPPDDTAARMPGKPSGANPPSARNCPA